MLYDQYFIDDLKGRADLVRIIQPYAQDLKKKGANWMACCPFHDEKTPSFSVNPAKGFYKCFGCGKGGTAFNFLMEIEGLSFPEAVQRVAEISGVPLPEPVDSESYERSKRKSDEKKELSRTIIELNKLAVGYWESALSSDTKDAIAARQYLETRGISDEVRRTFQIGFAPNSWDSLVNFLRENTSDETLIETSGLVSVNEEGNRIFDRFRGRIIFPVLDANGEPIAFGARALGSEQPKYLNSPETAAYVKGRHLYGLFQSREEIRKKKFAILVEGYLDLIALHQFGIKNVVASLGTAFTIDQARLLSRFSKKVVVNYDGDSAGISAAKRAVQELLATDFEVKVLVLPEGSDPDDFIRSNGAEAYNAARGRAESYLNFALDASMKDRSITNPRQKADAIEEVLPLLSLIRNPIQKRDSFDQSMEFFRIDDLGIRRSLWHSVRNSPNSDAGQIRAQARRASRLKVTIAEQHLLDLIVHDVELRKVVMPLLETSDFEALATAPIFSALINLNESGDEVTLEALENLVDDPDLKDDFIPLLMMGQSKRSDDEAIDEVLHDAENCVLSLRTIAIDNRLHEVSRNLALAEQSKDPTALGHLVAEHLELSKMKQAILNKIA